MSLWFDLACERADQAVFEASKNAPVSALDSACETAPDLTQFCRWSGARLICVSRLTREERRAS